MCVYYRDGVIRMNKVFHKKLWFEAYAVIVNENTNVCTV